MPATSPLAAQQPPPLTTSTATTTTAAPNTSSLADAIEDAQQRIANLLQHPDDLVTKSHNLFSKITSEKASIDAVLKASAQSQLDDTQDGLKFLLNSQSLLSSIRSNLGSIHSVCLDSTDDIANYPRIKSISLVHHNFQTTRDIVVQFQSLNKNIERLSRLLDLDSADILSSSAPNILLIHFELHRLEEFRDLVLYRAQSQGQSVVKIVSKYFLVLDSLSLKFTSYLWELARNIFPLMRENRGSVIVKLLKIVEAEELADEIVLNNSSSPSAPSIPTQRTIKNYRSQLFSAMHERVAVDFLDQVGSSDSVTSSIMDALDRASFVFDNLTVVFEDLVPRFPPRYKVMDFFVLQYHKQVYDLLNRLTADSLETRDILGVTSWVRDYYRSMADRFSVSEELLEPRLLDDRESSLIQDYVTTMKKKLLEWADRLLTSERSEFRARENPPQTENDDTYSTDSIVIFFQMINQQLEVAIDAARGGRLLLDVSRQCFNTMEYFQKDQAALIADEEAKFLNGEDLAPGLPEYVIAVSNNHMKGTEYVETIQRRLESELDDALRSEATSLCGNSVDGFLRVSKRGLRCLNSIVFKDLQPAFAQLFAPQWYEQNQIMASILNTLEDYLQDFKAHLSEYLFTKFLTDCMEKFAVLLLQSLRQKSVKQFRMPFFAEKAKADLTASTEFWCQYKSAKRVNQQFDLIRKIHSLFDSSESMMFLSWYSIWKAYSDVPISFVEELMLKRDDVDRIAIKELISTSKEKTSGKFQDATTGLYSVAFP